jgi:hypothetical protein
LPSVQISKFFDCVLKCKGPISKINKICIIMCYRPSHVCYRERNDNYIFIQIAFVESLVGPNILIFVFSASKIVYEAGYEKDL